MWPRAYASAPERPSRYHRTSQTVTASRCSESQAASTTGSIERTLRCRAMAGDVLGAEATPLALRLDVATATGSTAPLEIAALLFVPERVDTGRTPLVTCLHGGGYDKRYYHLDVPGHPGYSM